MNQSSLQQKTEYCKLCMLKMAFKISNVFPLVDCVDIDGNCEYGHTVRCIGRVLEPAEGKICKQIFTICKFIYIIAMPHKKYRNYVKN